MDIVRHLRYFVAVADEESITGGADRLQIGQPPVSRAMARLEAFVGTRLLERSGSGSRLTAAGRLLLPEAREIIARTDALAAHLNAVAGGESSPGASPGLDDVECLWQVVDLASGDSRGSRPDAFLPMASVAKVPLVLIAARYEARGRVDLARSVTLHPDGRTRGTTGISAMRDPITVSLRDCAYLALTISDNAAADALWDALGVDRVRRDLERMGLNEIRLIQPMRDAYDDSVGIVTDPEQHPTNEATPRALTHMLAGLWNDTLVDSAHAAWIRNLMRRQAWHQRIAAAFPAEGIEVAAKSGTLGPFRNEIGVVSYPTGERYAAAVLTNALTAHPNHGTDTLIGEVVRSAVMSLRTSRATR